MAAGAGAIAGALPATFKAFVGSLIPDKDEAAHLNKTFGRVEAVLRSPGAGSHIARYLGAGVNIEKVEWVGSSSQERDTAIAGESDLDCALILPGLPEPVTASNVQAALLGLAKHLVDQLSFPGTGKLLETAGIIRVQTTSVGIRLAEKKDVVRAISKDIPLVDIDLVLHTQKSGNDMVLDTDGGHVGTIATVHADAWKEKLASIDESSKLQVKHVVRVLKTFCKEALYLKADDSHTPLWPSYLVEEMLMEFGWDKVIAARDVYSGCLAAIKSWQLQVAIEPYAKTHASRSPTLARAAKDLEAKWKRQNKVGFQTQAMAIDSKRLWRICREAHFRAISVAAFKEWAKTKARSVP